MQRVYFFDNYNLSIGYNLDIAEARISEIERVGCPSDVEGIIELWHIYKLFKNNHRLERWSKEDFSRLKKISETYKENVAKYFNELSHFKVDNEYDDIDFEYKESFWEIVSVFKSFNCITSKFLEEIICNDKNGLHYVLSNKSLVEKYKNIIHKSLLNSKYTVYILLDKYVDINFNRVDKKIYLPDNFTVQEKENIISDYLDSNEVNINYVRLICQSRDVDGFILSPKIRYKSKKLEKKLNDEIINNPNVIVTETKSAISFSSTENIPVVSCSFENGYPSYIYSLNYIKESTNERKIFFVANIFKWFNKHGFINLINKNNEIDVLEIALMTRGRYSYSDFNYFQYKNDLSLFQLQKYSNALKELGYSFENELKTFYEQKLYDEFGYPGLGIELPINDDKCLIKCRIIFPEFDNISKQYDTYSLEGEIDPDYISFLKPMKIGETKSLLKCKYINITTENQDVTTIMRYLFSMPFICCIGPFRNKKYRSLAELLDNEIVYYSYYEQHIRPYLDFLINKEILFVDNEGVIRYKNIYEIEILKILWEFNSCSYWHLDENGREVADEMIKKGWAVADDHLLSKEERDYFSFYIDNEKFTNGYSYRNHYAHSSNPPTDDVNYHITAYLVLLKLLTMLVIKIYDDLWLARKVMTIDLKNKYINNKDNDNNNNK
jgi:hypothetical protein